MQKSQPKNRQREAFEDVSRAFQAGDLREANAGIEALLADHPDNINFLHLGGLIKQQAGEFDLAEKLLTTAYALRPEQPDLIHNLAVFFLSRGKLDQAVPLYETLLKIVPDQAPVWANYGYALRQQGHMARALEALLKAQALDPHKFDIEAAITLTKRQMAQWDQWQLAPEKVTAALSPVFIDDPFKHLEIVKKAAASIKPVVHYEAQAIPQQDRLRIGYLSNDLHDHATSYLIAELFALHDRQRYEIFVYSYGTDDQSPVRQRMKLAAEHWIECGGKTATNIADRIFRDRINILVDLKGYTRGGLPEVLASRPANVIMQWLGYPGSMGAPFVDYIIADKTLVPAESREAYSEHVLSMPHSYQINDRQRAVKPPRSRADYGLPEDALVLASFCQIYKITPPIFDVWMRVLKDMPKAVLWLFAAHEDAIANLQKEATARGVDPLRLVFARRVSPENHLARYHAVDLVFDTCPYGGHTTTSDALWAGAPVVALAGKSFAARVSASLLHGAGLSELVTGDLAEYEAKIRALINAPQERARLKDYLTKKRNELPLFDAPAFVRALENGYGQIWQMVQNKTPFKDVDAG
jgi:predicted O-linked N-acetylglucosamine transferase (SPINDLY family)